MTVLTSSAPSPFADSPGPMSLAQEGGVAGDEHGRARFLIVLLRYVDTLIGLATSYRVAPMEQGSGFVMSTHSRPFRFWGPGFTSPSANTRSPRFSNQVAMWESSRGSPRYPSYEEVTMGGQVRKRLLIALVVAAAPFVRRRFQQRRRRRRTQEENARRAAYSP